MVKVITASRKEVVVVDMVLDRDAVALRVDLLFVVLGKFTIPDKQRKSGDLVGAKRTWDGAVL